MAWLILLAAQAFVPSRAVAQPPAVQLNVTSIGTDATAHQEFSTGYKVSFGVYNTGNGPQDAIVHLTCTTESAVARCSVQGSAIGIPPGQNVSVDVTVDFDAAGTSVGSGKVHLTARDQDPSFPSATGSLQFTNIVPAQASFTPATATVTKARGTLGSQSFTLTNNGLFPTAFDLTVACQFGASVCTRSPARTSTLAPGASEAVTVSYTPQSGGTGDVQLQASLSYHVVATAALTVKAADAAVAVLHRGIGARGGTTGFQFSEFVVSKEQWEPDATFDVSISRCTVVTNCHFVGGGTTTTVTLNAAQGSVTVPVVADIPLSGAGFIALDVSYAGTLLNSGTISIGAVSASITPATASMNVPFNTSGNSYGGFTVTNAATSPEVLFTVQMTSCGGVLTNCRFASSGTASDTMTLGAAEARVVPIVYDAPAQGSGAFAWKVSHNGFDLATATLSVSVTGPITATVDAVAPQPNLIGPNQGGVSQTFTLKNTSSQPTSFTFAHNCTAMPAPAAAVSCTTPPAVNNLAPGASVPVTVNFTGGATKGAQSTLTLQALVAGLPAVSGDALLTVPDATVDGPPPALVPLGPPQTATFTVTNTTNRDDVTFGLAAVCSGHVSNCSITSGSGSTLTLTPGGSDDVVVQYTGASAGAGNVYLEAHLGTPTGPFISTGTAAVTVQQGVVAMVVTTANLTGDSVLVRGQCVAASLGADIASECGDLRIVHGLPGVRTMNAARAPVLSYVSGHAIPVPIVPADLTLPKGALTPTTVSAVLKINTVQMATGSWPGSQWVAGATRRVTLGFNALGAGLATGVYPYTLDVTTTYTGGSVVSSATGQLVVVNRSTSAFGAGWWLLGFEQLDVSNGARLVWTGGDGSVRIYTQRAGSTAPNRVWGALSVSYPDSIREVGTEFVRQLPDSVWVTFDAQGRHVRTRNRLGHLTSFGYDGSGRLGTITLPTLTAAALSYIFTYDANGRLATVAAPGARTVTVTTNAANGRVTSIQDPPDPNVGTRLVQFGYGGDHRIVTRTNGRGAVTTFEYDAASRVSKSTLAMAPQPDIIHTIANWQLQGASGTAVDTSFVRLVITGPRGGVTRFALNRFGAPTSIVDPLQQTTTLVRSVTLPGLVETLTAVTGQVTTATYDDRGRLLTSTAEAANGARVTTRYDWDGRWDAVIRITNPEGDFTAFGVNPANGNREWQEDNRGSNSHVGFGYTPENLLATVTLPAGGGANQGYFYDALGNLTRYDDENDFSWSWANNGIGLPSTIRVPTGTKAGGSPWEQTVVGYTQANLERTSTRTGGSESITVTNGYDVEGNLVSVRRSWSPNPTNINAQTTSYSYDNADRTLTQTESGGGTQQFSRDGDGNITTLITRRGDAIGMGYDLLNRLTSRSIPSGASFAYPTPDILPVYGGENAPYNYSRPAESQSFTYDPSNQVATANGLDAEVSRGYHVSGALTSETIRIKSRDRASAHSYTIDYRYDGNNRRTSLQLRPSSLFPGQSMRYGYTGHLLTGVTDIAGNSYTFGYNGRDELETITRPAGIVERFTYDPGGRMVSDVINRPPGSSITFPNVTFTALRTLTVSRRNARGQIEQSLDAGGLLVDYPTASYSGLGYLVQNTLNQTGYVAATGKKAAFSAKDTYGYDGLGNLTGSTNWWGLPPVVSSYTVANDYDAGTNRLSAQTNTTNSGSSRRTVYEYDASGNSRMEITKPNPGTNSVEERALWYAGDDRVVAVDRRAPGRRWFEEYRYDALGRRVWASTTTSCWPTNELVCLTNGVRRTIWDGTARLAEIQAPIDPLNPTAEELDQNFPVLPSQPLPAPYSNGDPNPYFGRVVYAPGLAVDQPISVTRYEYKDSPPGSPQAGVWPSPLTIMPFWDYRGTPIFGLFTDGTAVKPLQQSQGQKACPNPGVETADRCVLLQWPFSNSAYNSAFLGGAPTPSWFGSLLQNGLGAAGLEDHRARLYDPKTGRFTQEDPIGLAGGMNLYGYAGGDPVNSSDPFGLSPACVLGLPCPIVVGGGAVLGGPLTVFVAAVAGVVSLDALFGRAGGVTGVGAPAAADATAYRPGGRFSRKTKEQIRRDATEATGGEGTCEYCGIELTPVPGSPNSEELDHLRPRSKGGDNSPENGWRSCRTCNRRKGDKDAEDPRGTQPQPS